MRASPPVQLALMLAVFVLLAVPLVQLTSGRVTGGPKTTLQTSNSGKVRTNIRIRYAHKPDHLSVTLGNQNVVSDGANLLQGMSDDLVIPEEGVELQVEADWPAGTPDTALTIEMEPDSLETQSQTRWSHDGRMSEIIVYQWKR
jgi:hypothetical protein